MPCPCEEDKGLVAGKEGVAHGLNWCCPRKEVWIKRGHSAHEAESGIDLEESLDEAGYGLKVLDIEGMTSAIEACKHSMMVSMWESEVNVGLVKIKLVDLVANLKIVTL